MLAIVCLSLLASSCAQTLTVGAAQATSAATSAAANITAAAPVPAPLSTAGGSSVLIVNPSATQVCSALQRHATTTTVFSQQAPLTSLPQIPVNPFAAANIAVDLLKARFCTPSKFSPPRSQGHVFLGPGLSLQITTGSVIINASEILLNKSPAYNKTLPAINVVATPAEFLSKTSGRASVSTNFCRLQRNFGQQTTRVLAVFDGDTSSSGRGLDRQAVITTIVTEVSRLQRANIVEEQLIIGFLRANKLLVPFARVVSNATNLAPAPAPAPSTRSPALPFAQFSTFERLAPSLSF